MKFNYKKIASVFASAVMLSSTVGFAAAANYPTPFTEGSAVVYGADAAPTDMAAAIDVYDQLRTRTTSSSTSGASVTGDAKAVETASQPLYMGDYMNTTKSTFTKDDLKTVLASGKLTDDDGKELTYELKVDVPNVRTIYGETADNLDSPVVYADFDSSLKKYGLRIVFPTAVNMTKLTDESITIFGKNYVFTGRGADLTTIKAILFEKATPVIINDGESKTVEGHTMSVAVEDADTASITVDGVSESKDEGWSGKINGVDLYVKNIVGPNVAGTSRYVEVYLNSNKLTLDNADEAILGSTDISGTNVTFVSSSGKVSEIRIDGFPYSFDNDVKYVKKGDKFIDPVFGSLKFELSSLTPDLEATTRDSIVIRPSGDRKVDLDFTNRAGTKISATVLGPSATMLNSTYELTNGSQGAHTYNATALKWDIYDIITTPTGSANESDYFITCSGDYTQMWRVDRIKTTASDQKVTLTEVGGSSVEISLSGITEGSTASLTLGDGSSTTVRLAGPLVNNVNVSAACNYFYTKSGAKIHLSQADSPTSNLSKIIIEEETIYNGGAFTDNVGATLGNNITVRFAYQEARSTGRNMFVRDSLPGGTSGITYWSDDVGDNDYYYLTEYGTFEKRTGDADKTVSIWYPQDAMKVGFYIGEVASAITPGSTGSSTGGTVNIVKDTEVSSVSDKNLFVVGGSCVNTVAAKILGSDSPLCASDFSTLTKVSAGGYIIKVVASPYNDKKIAMLVAGYNAADTQNAVKRAMVIDGVKTDVGSEEVYPVTATS